ncbi:MAG: elongation factor P--(R)-beta-lysine ligase [Spirochaetales bacterium]|nr:elongation factor P--(R)-beta-lysine ligase [Spirochaetales bacterium]
MKNEYGPSVLHALLSSRSRFFQATRSFFIANNYLEVDTPVLAPFCIPEPSIELFETQKLVLKFPKGKLYLVSSPELWMKRLLALGIGNQFQISKCFRNNEVPGTIHLPEFTMLEWYAVHKNYTDNIGFTEDLILSVLHEMDIPGIIQYQGNAIDFSVPWNIMTMQEACSEYSGIDLSKLQKPSDFYDVLSAKHIEYHRDDTWEELFHRLFLLEVEPSLPAGKPLFLTDYPKNIKTLAKEASCCYSERWELYIGGIEIANCYTEAAVPGQIDFFFEEESKRKAQQCIVIPPSDNELQELMRKPGFPDCSGVALGMDRLLMILLDKKHISDVAPFSSFLL